MKTLTRIDSTSTKKTLRIFYAQYLSDRKSTIPSSVMVLVAHTTRYVGIPLVISFIVQNLISSPTQLAIPLVLLLLLTILSIITSITNSIGLKMSFKHEIEAEVELSDMVMQNLLFQSYEFYSNHKVGSLAGDVNGFTKSYSLVMDTVNMVISPVIINFVVSIIVIGILSPVLLLPIILVTGGILYLVRRSLLQRAAFRNERKVRRSKLNGLIADILANSLLVKIFATERAETNRVKHDHNKIAAIFMKENKIITREAQYRFAALYSFQIITLLIGILLYNHSLVSIAALIFAVTYFGRLSDSLFTLGPAIKNVEQAFLDAAPITDILDNQIDIRDQASATDLNVDKGELVFEKLGFSYSDDASSPVFKNLSLTIPAGQRVGLAGPSGGGKTTFTKLLLRFADIESGSIRIDAQDISLVTQSSLRSKIAYVPQDPYLFHRSLRDNIAYGKLDADDEEIARAAKKAYAWEFIEKLPNGLDTIVGERGVKLSGGQRQRIAIARAILKDAPILVLDEATSALDSESEKYIQDALHELMKGRTSIVIAHRLSTIAKLDRTIVLDDGKIVEDGTHPELIGKNGTYAKLWNHQSGGFIED